MQHSKSISIPYIPELDNMNLAEVQNYLNDHGQRFTIESLNWAKDYPYHPLTVCAIAHSGKEIFIEFFVRCNYLRAMNYTNNSPVCEDSCVEFFIAPKCDARYWNLNSTASEPSTHPTGPSATTPHV